MRRWVLGAVTQLHLGKQVVSDRANALDRDNDPDFYRCLELNTELPGPSQLKIEAWDKDAISADDLIGTTVIDLEDRLFDSRWNAMGAYYQTPKLYAPRPVEHRPIYFPTRKTAQGTLKLWVDIMTASDVKQYPPVRGGCKGLCRLARRLRISAHRCSCGLVMRAT